MSVFDDIPAAVDRKSAHDAAADAYDAKAADEARQTKMQATYEKSISRWCASMDKDNPTTRTPELKLPVVKKLPQEVLDGWKKGLEAKGYVVTQDEVRFIVSLP